ncbi:MAG: STAS domain-containing protein [Prevotella sp.]|nr:STAS domain-containing protein [Prevotella sp.]
MAAAIYKLGASLDSSNSSKEQEKILAIIEKGNSVIIDMTDCTYLSSAGLRVLLYSHKVAGSKGLGVYIVGLGSEVRDVMEITGFVSFFKIFDTLEACQNEVDK